MAWWKYKYSFKSGTFFIVFFFFKELVINSPNSNSIPMLVISYLMMVLTSIALFLGFVKYSRLNEKILLFWATIFTALSYLFMVVAEFMDRVFSFSKGVPSVIPFLRYFMVISLFYWSISLFIQKKIYGKSTILQGVLALLLGLSLFIPIMAIFQLPFFILFFISITYLVNKNENKLNKKKSKLNLLNNKF